MQQQDIQATWIQMWKVIFPGKTLNNTGKIISSGHYEKQKLLKTVLDRNQRVNWCWFDSFQSFSMSVGHERWKETFDEYWLKCTFHWRTMQKDRVLKYLWWVFHGFALLMFMKVYDITWKSMMSHESLWCLTWKSMMPLETACSELALWLTSVTDVQCDHCVTCVPKSLTLAINFRSTGSEAVCDNTQNLNETESETFFRYQIFPIPNPILFSIPNFFDTESDTFFETNFFILNLILS